MGKQQAACFYPIQRHLYQALDRHKAIWERWKMNTDDTYACFYAAELPYIDRIVNLYARLQFGNTWGIK